MDRRVSDSVTALESLLSAFSDRVGLGSIPVNEEGVAHLIFDGETQIFIGARPGADQVVLFADLGRIRPDKRSEGYRLVLSANAGHRLDPAGEDPLPLPAMPMAFALNRDTGTLVVSDFRGFKELDAASFEQWLRAFLEVAERWQDHFKGGLWVETAGSADSEPRNGSGFDPEPGVIPFPTMRV